MAVRRQKFAPVSYTHLNTNKMKFDIAKEVGNGKVIEITYHITDVFGKMCIRDRNGTVVTIIDGYWAFDGVKSEYPAKGDKGDQGEPCLLYTSRCV